MLPFELWNLVSLYFNPHKLSLVCKLFASFYDDYWYKQKLTNEYPQINLWTSTSYKELYNKSCKSGLIEVFHRDINNDYGTFNFTNILPEGIKVAKITNDGIYMILKFNGELWCYIYDSGTQWLLDTNVIDIDSRTYMKINEWYIVNSDNEQNVKNELILKIDEPLLSIVFYDDFICAVTSQTLYCMCMYDDELHTFKLINEVKKMASISHYIGILDVNDNLTIFSPFSQYFLIDYMSGVKDIFPGIIILHDTNHIVWTYSDLDDFEFSEDYDDINQALWLKFDIHEKLSSLFPNEIQSPVKLINSVEAYEQIIFLANNKIYISNWFADNIYMLEYTKDKNVKNIFGWCGTLYIVFSY